MSPTDTEEGRRSGFHRGVDMGNGIEDFPSDAMVPVPRYYGTMTWEYPPRWGEEGDP